MVYSASSISATLSTTRAHGPAALHLVPRDGGGLTPQESRQLARELRDVTRAVRNIEVKLDGIGVRVSRATTVGGPSAAERARDVERALDRGVERIVLEGDRRNGVMARIAGFSEPVWLGRSTVLPALLEALGLPGGAAPGVRLVGYKSGQVLIEAIAARCGKRVTPKSLRTQIGILRNRLAEAGMSRKLIQTRTRVGYRFVLRADGEVIKRRGAIAGA